MNEGARLDRRRALGLLGGGVLSSLAACAPRSGQETREPDRHVIIVLTVDSLRTSRIGVYGYDRPTTPTLDRLAGQSSRFTRAFTECSWTKPAMASFFLARPVHEHLVVFHLHSSLRDAAILDSLRKVAVGTPKQKLQAIARGTSVPPHLQPFHVGLSGFKKIALVNNPQVGAAFGFDRGWNVFRPFPPKSWQKGGGAPLVGVAERLHRRALRFLDNHPQGDLYLWLHHNDVHWPYGPAESQFERFGQGFEESGFRLLLLDEHRALLERARDDPHSRALLSSLYDAGLRTFDDELGRFFQALRERGLFDEATIILTADHGEEFWEHGSFGHGNDLFGVTTSIPLFLKLPFQREGQVVDEAASLVDIGPTVLNLAGRPDPALPGRSLLPVVREGRSYGRGVLSEIVENGYEVSLVRWPHKVRIKFAEDAIIGQLNRGGTGSLEPGLVQVYDLAADPGEQRPLAAADRPELHARLRELVRVALGGQMNLSARLQAEVEAGRGNLTLPLDPNLELHREQGEQLRALGYL